MWDIYQWEAKADDHIIVWGFLSRGTDQEDESSISNWELAWGSSVHVIEEVSSADEASLQHEAEILGSLVAELEEHRFQDITLVTPTGRCITKLRTRLICSELSTDPSLRGFTHISLEDILDKYFEQIHLEDVTEIELGISDITEIGTPEQIAPHEMFEVISRIGPLIPRKALIGKTL